MSSGPVPKADFLVDAGDYYRVHGMLPALENLSVRRGDDAANDLRGVGYTKALLRFI
jgi:hypothetical protein